MSFTKSTSTLPGVCSDRPPVPRRGRPAELDLDRIVAVAGRMDPQRLTMSAVATELGVATSALYRWVDGRDGLLDLVSERLVARILSLIHI